MTYLPAKSANTLVLAILAFLTPGTADSFGTGHDLYFHVAGAKYPTPQAACDATAAYYGWPRPLFFRGTVGNICEGVSNNGCIDQVTGQNPGGGVSKGYECTGGFVAGGTSCATAKCIRAGTDIEKNGGPPECGAGNPVNVSNGNKYQLEVDLQPKSPSQIRIERSYNSYVDSTRVHITHWTFNYGQRLVIQEYLLDSTGSISAFRPDGGVVYFTKVGSVWTGEADGIATIEEVPGGGATQTGWRYIEADQSVEEYDLDGKLLSITDRNGNSQTLTYNATSGLIERIDTSLGDYLTYTHDSQNRIAKIRDNSNPTKSWTYQYDANDNLISVEFPDTTSKQYHYEDTSFPRALTGITDEKGIRFATWTYDAQGRALTSTHASGADSHSFAYNANGSTTVTNPLGKETTYHFSVLHGVNKITLVEGHATANCLAANKNYTYDVNGFPASKTDWNGISTVYTYNSRGLEVSRTEASGTTEARTVTTEWHPIYRVPTKITEPGLETTYTHDSSGNTLTKKLKDLTTNETRTTTWTYSGLGQVLTRDGPRTDLVDTATLTYHTCSTGSECGEINTVTNALGQVISFTQYNEHRQPTHITDENGTQIVAAYDTRQQLTKVTFDRIYSIQLTYDNVGQVTRITAPNGSYLDYEYDDAQRLVTIEDALGNRIEYTLDDAGNRVQIDVKDSSQVLRNTQTAIYDELSRLIGTIGGNSQTVDYGYDANHNLTSVAKASNPPAISQFDALNNLIQATDAASGITRYAYDGQNRVKTLTDPSGLDTTYTYNGFGDRLTIDSPDTGLTIYTYDEAGNVDTETDALSKLTTNSYDALNRHTLSTYADSSLNITYTYDDTQNGNKGTGRLTGIADGSGSTAYTYNSRGLVTSVDTIIGTSHYRIGYGYDNSNQLNRITYPSGRVVDYTYDSANRVIQVSTTKNSVTTILGDNITYEPFGPSKSMDYGNGLTGSRLYDLDYRLTNLTAGTLMDRSYLYDSSNNIDSITNSLAPAYNQTLDYDFQDRLTDSAGDYGDIDFAYDATGNRISMTLNSTQIETYSYANNSHHLASITGTNPQSFGYDLSGNTTSRSAITRVFDDRGRLSQSTQGTITTTYTYNALEQRVQKVSSAKATQFLYDLSGQLMAESSGSTGKEYIYLNGQPIAAVYTDNSTSTSTSTQFSISVGTKTDDAEERSTGRIVRGIKNLKIVEHKGNPGTTAIRIQNITIPQGAQITNAYLQFTARRSNSGTTGFSIQAEDIGNAPSITSAAFSISSRATTTAAVAWAPPAWAQGDANSNQQTPDISTVIQEVVDRWDWSSGNAMLVTITGSGYRRAHSRNSNAALAPELVVEYTTGSGQAAEELYYFHNDHLGTPQLMTNESQAVVWQGDYKPFGETTVTVATIENNLRFPGQYYDSESGLHYNYFRYYDPSIGRYTQSDPIGLNGGTSTYGYVGGNPLTSYDPYGLFGVDDVFGAIYYTTGGWSPSQSTVNIAAGFGDGISSVLSLGFYSTEDFRNTQGSNGGVNQCSNAYDYAKYAGYAWGVGTAWAGGLAGGSNSVFWSGEGAMAKAAQYGTTLEKTPIGGSLNWLGQRANVPYPVWQVASATFAANARGTAIKVGEKAGNMWKSIEKPILKVRGVGIKNVP